MEKDKDDILIRKVIEILNKYNDKKEITNAIEEIESTFGRINEY